MDWNPETYARFRGLRLRPALDLLAQVRDLPPGSIVDLGCGNGAVGEALAARFPDRALIGVDSSAAMLTKAAEAGLYSELVQADAAFWLPVRPAALIFSNAALHWLGDHDRLLPRLALGLAPGGTLAVQMPLQHEAPSHRLLRDLGATLFPDRLGPGAVAPSPVRAATHYLRLLARFGAVDAWETEYVQHLGPAQSGHPVRAFTESTAMRPYLDRLEPAERDWLTAAYDTALEDAYPRLDDGSVLFPFRRVFFTLGT